jgi:hypothetical protein
MRDAIFGVVLGLFLGLNIGVAVFGDPSWLTALAIVVLLLAIGQRLWLAWRYS